MKPITTNGGIANSPMKKPVKKPVIKRDVISLVKPEKGNTSSINAHVIDKPNFYKVCDMIDELSNDLSIVNKEDRDKALNHLYQLRAYYSYCRI